MQPDPPARLYCNLSCAWVPHPGIGLGLARPCAALARGAPESEVGTHGGGPGAAETPRGGSIGRRGPRDEFGGPIHVRAPKNHAQITGPETAHIWHFGTPLRPVKGVDHFSTVDPLAELLWRREKYRAMVAMLDELWRELVRRAVSNA